MAVIEGWSALLTTTPKVSFSSCATERPTLVAKPPSATITASRIMESVVTKRDFIADCLLHVYARSTVDEPISPDWPHRRTPPFSPHGSPTPRAPAAASGPEGGPCRSFR